MKTLHHDFEIQCLLAPSGHLTEREFDELLTHADSCRECRIRINQAIYVNSQLLGWPRVERRQRTTPHGALERFVWRANRAGLPIAFPKGELLGRAEFGLVTACLFAIVILVGSFNTSVSFLPSATYSITHPDSDLRASDTNEAGRTVASSSRVHSAGRIAHHHVVRISRVGTQRPTADLDLDRATRIDLGRDYSAGALLGRFRHSDLTETLRPVSFHLSFGQELIHPAIADAKSDACQGGFCFNPQWVLLASYDSPHMPTFSWTESSYLGGPRNSFSALPSVP